MLDAGSRRVEGLVGTEGLVKSKKNSRGEAKWAANTALHMRINGYGSLK